MPTTRTFIAVETGPDVRSRAASLIKKWKLEGFDENMKWVDPLHMHLTLKFLGDVDNRELPALCKKVEQAVREVPPFDFLVRGAGAFPNAERPRALWLGVPEGAEELAALHQTLDVALADLGYARENRRFSPHLTLGRPKQDTIDVRELLLRAADYEAGVTGVDEVVVFASYSDRKGQTYDALSHAELRGGMS